MRSFLSRLVNPVPLIRVDPAAARQEFEGWGTSLAWWATVVGGWSDPARNAIADLLFSPTTGLGLNIVRYNIGGGDDPGHRHMRPGGDVPGYQAAGGTWDWNADANQRWMLAAARGRGAAICEAFSNSPPYWMTRSGCAAGSADGGDNLQDTFDDSFAAYLAEVVAHFATEWDVVFRTVAPFNEPSSSWWKSTNRQEGCHFSRESQNALIPKLAAHLAARGLTGTTISAADEYSIDETVDTFNAYDGDALQFVSQINTHSYGGARRADLRGLAATLGKKLWMSEWGTGAGPHDHEAIAPALTLAQQIVRDMNVLRPEAWVYWQAVENEAANNWGFIHADFTGANERYWPTKQYYGMAQFSTFVRPGFRIVGTDDVNTLAGYERASRRLVLVYVNGTDHDVETGFDLAAFGTTPGAAMVYRTSATENMARLPDLPMSHHDLAVKAAAQSISTYIFDGIGL